MPFVDRDDPVEYARARTLVIGSILGFLVPLSFLFERLMFEPGPIGPRHATVALAAAAAFFAPFLYRQTGSRLWTIVALLSVVTVAIVSDAWVYGGLRASTFIAMQVVPLMGVLLGGVRIGVGVTIIQIAVVIAFYAMEMAGVPFPEPPLRERELLMDAAATIGVMSFVLLLGVVFDRERRSSEARLGASEQRYALAFASANDGLFEWDPDPTKGLVSRPLLDFLGKERPTSLSGTQTLRDAVHPDDVGTLDAAIQDTLATGEEHRFDLRLNHHSGAYRTVECRMAPLRSTEGSNRLLGTIRDVEEERHLLQMQSDFVSTVSHELRTPLTSIFGALKLLDAGRLGVLPEGAAGLVKLATNNSARLAELVDDLLDIQKLDAGQVQLKAVSVDLGRVVRESIEAVQAFADEREVRLQTEMPTEAIDLRGDRNRLIQVLVNLLSNAVKFSPRDAVVTIRVESDWDKARVSVVDHGRGIHPRFQPQVFDRFAQAGNTEETGVKGTGLGLAICKAIIELHDGEIGFDSALGKGTTFWFELYTVDKTP